MDDPTSMTDSPITTVAPGWAIVALGILGALASPRVRGAARAGRWAGRSGRSVRRPG